MVYPANRLIGWVVNEISTMVGIKKDNGYLWLGWSRTSYERCIG